MKEKTDAGKCPRCNGNGKIIRDWHAYNQLWLPVGFSREAMERYRQNAQHAFNPCPQCKGERK
jgi:hypothetical protein